MPEMVVSKGADLTRDEETLMPRRRVEKTGQDRRSDGRQLCLDGVFSFRPIS